MSIQPEARSNLTDIAFIKPGYLPTFLETFEGASGSLPSRSDWIIHLGTSYPGGPSQWGNAEFQTYTDSQDNIRVTSDKTLTITPRVRFGAASRGKLLIEARIKLGTAPAYQQQGIWNAFWAIGKDFRGNYWNWPAATEWDILEVINGDSIMYSTAHCGTRPGGPCKEDNGIGGPGANFSRGDFHTVRLLVDRTVRNVAGQVNWQTESMIWSLDGKGVFVHTGERVGDNTAWEKLAYDEHFLLLNIAIGWNWPGAPNAQTVDGPSVAMEVDYVGVWNSV
ncbi:concanavalin A-like lectin/glucanase domain-containing protein [Leptodontidium sp. 2 PMI_412]|nr:concanavalin A-like lectin/glucanase domain-containing protein [Leptodontidium sp. 2 PMI_412]